MLFVNNKGFINPNPLLPAVSQAPFGVASVKPWIRRGRNAPRILSENTPFCTFYILTLITIFNIVV